MKMVYIVMYLGFFEICGNEIEAVFSSRKKAQEYIDYQATTSNYLIIEKEIQ